MDREYAFVQALKAIKMLAGEQGNVVTREQIQGHLRQQELSDAQIQMVHDYLKEHKIGIDEKVDPEDYLTQEDTDYLEVYLQELKTLPQLTQGEKEAVMLSAMAGEMDAKKKLIEIFLPEVVDIARLYAGQGVFLEDLVGEGNVAAAMGVELLGCLESPGEVPGMLGKMIMDAMEEYINENTEAQETDKKIVERANDVLTDARELAELLARKITVAELANEGNFTAEEILEVMRITKGMLDYVDGEE